MYDSSGKLTYIEERLRKEPMFLPSRLAEIDGRPYGVSAEILELVRRLAKWLEGND